MPYTYSGDINIEHGGLYLNLEEFQKWKDFCPAVKITDLDSAIGFEGAIMIERGSIYVPEDPKKRKSALSCCGWENETDLPDRLLVEAFDAYAGVEHDSWNGMITIQTIKGGPMVFDGWIADETATKDFHESGMSLREFIESRYV